MKRKEWPKMETEDLIKAMIPTRKKGISFDLVLKACELGCRVPDRQDAMRMRVPTLCLTYTNRGGQKRFSACYYGHSDFLVASKKKFIAGFYEDPAFGTHWEAVSANYASGRLYVVSPDFEKWIQERKHKPTESELEDIFRKED